MMLVLRDHISVQCRPLSQAVWCKACDSSVYCRASTLCTALSSRSWPRRSARQRFNSQISRALTHCLPCLPLVSSGPTLDPVDLVILDILLLLAPHGLLQYYLHLCHCLEAFRSLFAATDKLASLRMTPPDLAWELLPAGHSSCLQVVHFIQHRCQSHPATAVRNSFWFHISPLSNMTLKHTYRSQSGSTSYV